MTLRGIVEETAVSPKFFASRVKLSSKGVCLLICRLDEIRPSADLRVGLVTRAALLVARTARVEQSSLAHSDISLAPQSARLDVKLTRVKRSTVS